MERRRELGQLADATLHPAVPTGVLLPGVLGVRTSDPALLPSRARLRTLAGISIQLLWFLGAYVLVLAAVPLLARITTPAGLLGAVASTYAFIAVIDAVRVNVDVPACIGYLNLVAWLIPGMLGVAYRRRLLDQPRRRAARRRHVRRQRSR